jgi:predicted anti-sigma-YlaC factor YlaD
MNCQLCQKELEAYRGGNLSPDTKTLVEIHLTNCKECAKVYQMQLLIDNVISKEKELISNPFLSTRIMSAIENPEISVSARVVALRRALRAVLLTVSLSTAIFAGIVIGKIYKPAISNKQIPVELALMDDSALESTAMLSNE